jgi:hypothetical protein
MLKRLLFPGALLLLVAVFVISVGGLCVLRFRRGDVYPYYSSLRADALGVEVFYNALGSLNGPDVDRNYRPLWKLQPREPLTLFYVGVASNRTTLDWEDLRRLALEGNRVVLAFVPTTTGSKPTRAAKRAAPAPTVAGKTPGPATPKPVVEKKTSAPKKPKKSATEEEASPSKTISWEDALKTVGVFYRPRSKWQGADLKAKASEAGLEPVLSWHGTAWIEPSGPTPTPLYTCEDKPVMIECPVGRGSLVLASDSYFLSNEAMRDERAPALLAALAGGNRRVVFDESHLGSEDRLGLASLARQYRLEGVGLALLLVAVLYIWKNALPLLPREAGGSRRATVLGRDAAEGFVNLMRRTIPPTRIVAVCVEEWNAAFAASRGYTPEPPPPPGVAPVVQFSQLARKHSKKIQ